MRYADKAKRITKSRRKARGAIAVEFALLLIPLLLIVAGIIEFGRTFWYYDALVKSTRDGARFMTTVPKATLGDASVSATPESCDAYAPTAKGMVYCAALKANVPDFDTGKVVVECDYGSGWIACANRLANDPAPIYVRVAITRYEVKIGSWIPFITPTGATTWPVTLSPSTTMRYMR